MVLLGLTILGAITALKFLTTPKTNGKTRK